MIKVFFNVWAWIILVTAYLGGSMTLLLGAIELLELMGLPAILCAALFVMGMSLIIAFFMSGCNGETLREAVASALSVSLLVMALIGIIAAVIGLIYLMSTYLSLTAIVAIGGTIALILTGLIALNECGFVRLGSRY